MRLVLLAAFALLWTPFHDAAALPSPNACDLGAPGVLPCVEFARIARGDRTWYVPAGMHVFETAEEWASFWEGHQRSFWPFPPLPSIDFSTHWVAAIVEEHQTGEFNLQLNHRVRIEQIVLTAGTFVVHVDHGTDSAGVGVARVFDYVRVPRLGVDDVRVQWVATPLPVPQPDPFATGTAMAPACGVADVCGSWQRIEFGDGAAFPGYHVINDEVSWRAFWTEYTSLEASPRPLPPIDFHSRFVAAVVDWHSDCCDGIAIRTVVRHHGANAYVIGFDHVQRGGLPAFSSPTDIVTIQREIPGELALATFVGPPVVAT